MARAQVDPEDLKRFARELRQFNTELEALVTAQRARLTALGQAWRDQESRRFTEQFDQMLKVLQRMLETSNEHATLLAKKAGHIEQYLRQR